MWNGEFVSKALSIELPEETPEFPHFLGMALRKNKKRAHLLVSTVLGKHIPVSPATALTCAYTLADNIMLTAETKDKFTVFGYAETATCLGAAVAQRLASTNDVIYLHSTRYPVEGANEYGSFEESHSHATSHHITPADTLMLDDPERHIVLVDDELTTGSTVMNTIRLFESKAHHSKYFIATLTDMRTEEAFTRFAEFEKEMGIEVTVVSLMSTSLIIPDGSVEKAAPIIDELKTLEEKRVKVNGMITRSHHNQNNPILSLGLASGGFAELRAAAAAVAKEIPVEDHQRVLMLGLEEDMFFSMMVAYVLSLRGITADFSSTTRSPVITFDDPSYAINTRLRYSVPDDVEPRYAYNLHKEQYDKVVIVTNNKEAERSKDLIERLAEEFEGVHIAIVEEPDKTLTEPLTGEEGFSSYSGKDVKWLLKDISDADLEAPTEEREEAVQTGSSHYSESLPQEYLPNDDYVQLFMKSLHENKQKLAEAIGIVSERVYELRDRNPVLVSLARGGTPVGALMKRYLAKAYNVEVPHYSASIIRGRGIDFNALNYLVTHYNPSQIMFVDGWTGKGAISNELQKSLNEYYAQTGIKLSNELAVVADPGSCTKIYGTREDYLIPSACLNSTVSGLISRTVLNNDFIGPDDYHGAKYYSDFASHDKTNVFLDMVSEEFTNDLVAYCSALVASSFTQPPSWSGWKTVDAVKQEFGIKNLNLIKPGVGETTRVLLRRVPWAILINPARKDHLQHILLLAEERGVQLIERPELPYSCIGIIKPHN